jgi:hypothetical protein
MFFLCPKLLVHKNVLDSLTGQAGPGSQTTWFSSMIVAHLQQCRASGRHGSQVVKT